MPTPAARRLGVRACLVCAVVPLTVAAAPQRATFVHTPPAEARLGEPLPIEGTLAGASNFRRLVVRVRSPGEDYEDYTLELQYGDLYRVVLPASRMVPPGFDYYVEGVGDGDERTPLFASGARPVRVSVPGAEGRADGGTRAEPPKTELKCRKTKHGKKCWEEKVGEPTPKEPEPVEEPAARTPPAGPQEPPRSGREPAAADGGREAPRPAPAGPAPREATAEGGTASRAEPPRRRSELEEELAMYTAEDPGGVVQRLEESARRTVLAPVVLTAAQLRQLGVRYVHEALDLVPGLSVSRDVQGFWRVAVRGLRSAPEVLVTLDGQPLNGFYDGQALATLPIDNLARIEVSRGPATADTPLGGLLAVVNLVTNHEDGLRLAATGGLFEAFDGHLSAARTFGGLRLFADADVASQYGQRRKVAKDGLDTATRTRDKSTLDKRLLINAGAGLSFTSDKAGTLAASGRFMLENRSALIGVFDVVGNDSWLQWMVIQASLGWERPLASGGRLAMRLWLDHQSIDRLWQQAPDGFQVRAGDSTTLFPEGMLEQLRVPAIGIGLEARGELVLPAKNRLAVGLTGTLQSLAGYELLSNVEPGTNVARKELKKTAGVVYPTEDGRGGRGPAADRLTIGLHAFDTWTPNEVVSVQAGLRLDLVQLPSVDGAGAWAGKHLAPLFGPRLGVSVAPTNALVFRASYGRAWRAPTVQELAESLPDIDSNQGRFVGNPRLESAALDAVEVGFEHLQGLGEAKVRLRGAGFFDRFTNPIAMVDSTGNLVPYANRPLGAQALGLDGEARIELPQRGAAWLNASWVRAEDLGTPAQSRLLTDTPQVRLNAGFSVPLGRWLALDAVVRFASERRNDSRSVLELIRRYTLPGYTTVAAQLRTEPLFDRLVLSVLGQNVFGFDYADGAARPDRMNGVPREQYLVFGTARVEL